MNSVVIKCLYNINVLAGYTAASLSHRGPSVKQRQNCCSGLPPLYQDLITCHGWPVKEVIVNLPIRLKGNAKCISGNY